MFVPSNQGSTLTSSPGKCYCGVFGHPLRREYAVFSRILFKSREMVMAYPDKVVCDRPTFIYSNLDSENFFFLAQEKGMMHWGPIYEYREDNEIS